MTGTVEPASTSTHGTASTSGTPPPIPPPRTASAESTDHRVSSAESTCNSVGDDYTVSSTWSHGSDTSVAILARAKRKADRRKARAEREAREAEAAAAMHAIGDVGDPVVMGSGEGGVEGQQEGGGSVELSWKEKTTIVVLIGAFCSCLSVFYLLDKQQESLLLSDQQCDARTLLQLKLASYIYNGGNLSAVAFSDGNNNSNSHALIVGGASSGGDPDQQQTCGCASAQQIEDYETIIQVLLVAALLTVVGVTMLLLEENDDESNWSSSTSLSSSLRLGGGIPSRLLKSTMKDLSERALPMVPLRSRNSTGSLNQIIGSALPQQPQQKIADLFPDTTVLFADIVGFEAWSSQREPTQCLTLLDTIYDAFDREARAQGVFKVEAVADCYTAATGLPDERKDHAQAMAIFAHTCLRLFRDTTKSLEVSLGPDTSDLSLRVGIHSGPVTAIRGGTQKFQLFGDTVTTAATILNSSQAGKIQLSKETVHKLPPKLQRDWVQTRACDNIDEVDKSSRKNNNNKEKGKQRHWLVINDGQAGEEDPVAAEDSRIPRLVDWNVQLLKPVLHQIVSKRHAAAAKMNNKSKNQNISKSGALNFSKSAFGDGDEEDKKENNQIALPNADERAIDQRLRQGKLVIEEVEEVIELPKYDAALAKAQEEQEIVELSDVVVDQLHEYITTIAQSYKNNPFHNFAHASHVTMSVCKLLSRILAPKLQTRSSFDADDSDTSLGALDDDSDSDDELGHGTSDDDIEDDDDDDGSIQSIDEDVKQRIHDHTYGITSDPLTQFACMFSALIHDAEHDGVPNTQLVKEETELAARYKNQSVAEQNSVDVAWSILMQPRFKELRNAIYGSEEEMIHFRQLVVNCVMATDICDKQLKDLRNKRWDRAFAPKTDEELANPDPAVLEVDVNRKATIVIEHLLQASDVSHTMQHFHVFRKWNERLFLEMYLAYRQGRSTSDPSKFWYKGEIGFFDFYVIPLAKKLKECGVFGVSSDEYLNYATKNRQEWETKGERVVEKLIEKAENMHSRMQRHGSMDMVKSTFSDPLSRMSTSTKNLSKIVPV